MGHSDNHLAIIPINFSGRWDNLFGGIEIISTTAKPYLNDRKQASEQPEDAIPFYFFGLSGVKSNFAWSKVWLCSEQTQRELELKLMF